MGGGLGDWLPSRGAASVTGRAKRCIAASECKDEERHFEATSFRSTIEHAYPEYNLAGQTDGQADRQVDRQAGRCTGRRLDGDRQTDGLTDQPTERPTDRQIGRQTDM